VRWLSRAGAGKSQRKQPNVTRDTTAHRPEEKHGVKLRLSLLCDAAFAEFIVARTCCLVTENIVRLREVLEFGVRLGVVCKREGAV
jgi:hypothetical protein